MSTGLVIAVLSSLMGGGLVQPICTPRDFQNAFRNSIQGDNEFIAKVIFDDYAEQVQAINAGETEKENACVFPVSAEPQMARQGVFSMILLRQGCLFLIC